MISICSGVIDKKQILDYYTHCDRLTLKGKTKDFIYAVEEIKKFVEKDSQDSVTAEAPIGGKIRIKEERDDGTIEISEVIVNENPVQCENIDADQLHSKLISELLSVRNDYNKIFFEKRKLDDMLEAEKKSHKLIINQLETKDLEIKSQLDLIEKMTIDSREKDKKISQLHAQIDQLRFGIDLNRSHANENEEKKNNDADQAEKSIDQDENHEVERIINDKWKNGERYFLLKWKGFNNRHNRWVKKKSLSCPQLLRSYLDSKKKKK